MADRGKLAAFLQDLEALADDEASSVELLLRRLDPDTASMLRRVALTHQFDVSVIELLRAPDIAADATTLLARLTRLSMVSRSAGDLQLHDNARLHLLSRWFQEPHRPLFHELNRRLSALFEALSRDESRDETERRAYTRRHLYHALAADPHSGFDALEADLQESRRRYALSDAQTLLGFARELSAILSDEQRVRLLHAEGLLAYYRREWDNALAIFHEVVRAEHAPLALRVRALIRIGRCHGEQRAWARGHEAFEDARARVAGSGEALFLLPEVLAGRATLYRDQGDLADAQKAVADALLEAERVDVEPDALAALHNLTGTILAKAGRARDAITEFERSLVLLERTADRHRRAQVLNNLGFAHADLADWDAARDALEEALAIETERGDTLGRANAQSNLSRVFFSLDDVERGARAADEACALFVELRDWFKAGVGKRNAARSLRRAGHRDTAARFYAEAIAYFEVGGWASEAVATRAEAEAKRNRRGWLYFFAPLAFLLLLTVVLVIWPLDTGPRLPEFAPAVDDLVVVTPGDAPHRLAAELEEPARWVRLPIEERGFYAVHAAARGSDPVLWVLAPANEEGFFPSIGWSDDVHGSRDARVLLFLEPASYLAFAGFYDRSGHADLAIELLQRPEQLDLASAAIVEVPRGAEAASGTLAIPAGGFGQLLLRVHDAGTFRIRAQSDGSIDPRAWLFSAQGERPLLAEHDDEAFPEKRDPVIETALEPGAYLLVVTVVDGPAAEVEVQVQRTVVVE